MAKNKSKSKKNSGNINRNKNSKSSNKSKNLKTSQQVNKSAKEKLSKEPDLVLSKTDKENTNIKDKELAPIKAKEKNSEKYFQAESKVLTQEKSLKQEKTKKNKPSLLITTFIILTYLETFYKITIFGINNVFKTNTLILLILLLPVSSIIATISTLTKSPKKNQIIYFILMFIVTVFFNVALIFKKVFNTYFCLSLFGLTDQAVAFTGTAIIEIFKNIAYIIGLFIPFIIAIFIRKSLSFNRLNRKNGAINFLILFLSIPLFEIITYQSKDKENSIYNLFNTNYNNALNIEKIGVIPALYLDIKELLFKYDNKTTLDQPLIPNVSADNDLNNNNSSESTENKYTYNNLDIDFDSLINNEKNKTLLSIHSYFKEDEGTLKNEYTGLFKDKNLIVIMAESLNTIGIREDVTPTLYKLATTGFNFTNFYTPVNLSTIGGEFQNLTGLFANLNDLNKYFRKGTNYFPFGLGNVFKNIGYDVKAYHANDAYFQNRNTYLKTMGFDYFEAKNTGLEKLMDCNTWPASDNDMVKVTSNEWINSSKFLTYYVSVSSHMPYNKSGNAIVSKNWQLVKDMNLSDEAKSYLASVIELDRAVASLIETLEENNKLDDTVIAIIPDHYPYSMDINSINELSTYKRDETIEVNHNSLIIWNNNTPSVTVDKTASQLDFLPTLYNLFGISYDSRLFMGKDILSTAPGLVYFQNKSWVSDYGTYYANSGKFVAKKGVEVPESYVSNINKIVANRINMSKLIIENNYYDKINYKE